MIGFWNLEAVGVEGTEVLSVLCEILQGGSLEEKKRWNDTSSLILAFLRGCFYQRVGVGCRENR